MSRLAKSTDDEIIAMGLQIKGEGKPVSAFAIRNALKGGCSDRINIVWREFIEQRGNRLVKVNLADKIDLPPELIEQNSIVFKEKLSTFALECYRVSQAISNERINSLAENYKEKIRYFESAENQALVALNRTDSELERLDNELDLSEKQRLSLLAELNKSKGIVETLEKRLAMLERREDEYLKSHRRFGKVEAKMEALSKHSID
jgi:hypothetical protein